MSDTCCAVYPPHVLCNAHPCALRCSLDLRELEQYDPATGRMLGLRMSQAMFAFDFRSASSTLVVRMHRKELPVSTNFGDAPFVLTLLLKPVGELVVSSSFHVASKEAPVKAPRPPPKRQRPPSSKLPTVAPAAGDELLISQHCKALKRLRPVRDRAVPGSPDSPLKLRVSYPAYSAGSGKSVSTPFDLSDLSSPTDLDAALALSLYDGDFELPELDFDDLLFSA